MVYIYGKLNSHLLFVLLDSSAFLITHTCVKLSLAVALLSCSGETQKSLLVVPTLATFKSWQEAKVTTSVNITVVSCKSKLLGFFPHYFLIALYPKC